MINSFDTKRMKKKRGGLICLGKRRNKKINLERIINKRVKRRNKWEKRRKIMYILRNERIKWRKWDNKRRKKRNKKNQEYFFPSPWSMAKQGKILFLSFSQTAMKIIQKREQKEREEIGDNHQENYFKTHRNIISQKIQYNYYCKCIRK